MGATDHGGSGIVPEGDSLEVNLRFLPGRYTIVCWSDNHVVAGVITALTVTEGAVRSDSVAAPPTADGYVALQDFQFADAVPFRAGSQVLHV